MNLQTRTVPDTGIETTSNDAPPVILVVDEDWHLRALLKDRLQLEGFSVVAIGGGDEVIEVVEHRHLDAVIIDRRVGGADNLVFFIQVCRGTPIILLAESDGGRSHAWARRQGVAGYFTKPIKLPILVGTLSRLTARSSISPDRADLAAVSQPAPLPAQAPGMVWAIVHTDAAGAALAGKRGRIRSRRQALVACHPHRLRRVVQCVAPAVPSRRTFVVGRRHQGKCLETQFVGPDRPRLLLQPCDRGSATEVLLAAYCIQRLDRDATVAVVPPSRDVMAPSFAAGLAEAAKFVHQHPRWIFLVGARTGSSRAASWVVPSDVLGCSSTAPVWRARRLVRGVHRPRHGPDEWPALRCTGVVVVKAGYLVDCARRLVPALHRQLLQTAVLVGTPAEARALNRAYATIPRLEFDTAILEPSLAHLAISLLPEPWPGSERPVATPSDGSGGSTSC